MQTLPTELQVGGFDLKQVERKGSVAIYSQSKGGAVISYEVIKVQLRPAEIIHGKPYPERETYPGNEKWGLEAWSCVSLERAKLRLNGMAQI